MQRDKLPKEFERITINQMITLVNLYDFKFAHEVASHRNSDLSSINKQLDTLNSSFLILCGEQLVDTGTSRGRPVEFSPTGEMVVDLLRRFLGESRDVIDKRRREVGKKLTAASTAGMLSMIAKIWPKWQERARGEFELSLSQIRTHEVRECLESGKVDLVFSGIIDHERVKHDYEDFEFLRLTSSSKVVLLSNHKHMPADPVKLNDIAEGNIAVIMPNHGIIRDFVDLVVGGNLERADIVAYMDDLPFGRALLSNNIYQASMFVIESLADIIIKEQIESDGIPFHKYAIKGVEGTSISSGVFRRRSADKYTPTHPVNVCWEILKEESTRLKMG